MAHPTRVLWHRFKLRLTGRQICVEPAQHRFRLAENRNIDASRRTSLSCNQRFLAKRDGWGEDAFAHEPAERRRGQGTGNRTGVVGHRFGDIGGIDDGAAYPALFRFQAVLREPRQGRGEGRGGRRNRITRRPDGICMPPAMRLIC